MVQLLSSLEAPSFINPREKTHPNEAPFLFLLFLGTVLVTAQQFNHVVIVIQENRTPDNLFSSCLIPGADLVQVGSAVPLAVPYDLGHTHSSYQQNAKGKWSSKSKGYVQASNVQPYCQLANQGGFANRMFQTNQGPSYPAHQFLFGGHQRPQSHIDHARLREHARSFRL